MPSLKDWSIVNDSGDNFPNKRMKLTGKIYLSEIFKDGVEVITSPIQSFTYILDGQALTSNGTNYYLGMPSKKWMDWLRENKLEIKDYEGINWLQN